MYTYNNKVSKKYLKIAYFGMQCYYCVSRHGVPPPRRSQQRTLPLLKIFIFFIFQHRCLPGVSVIVVRTSCLCWSVEAQPTD